MARYAAMPESIPTARTNWPSGHPEPAADVPELLGDGNLAFTVDQGVYSERYQGIVGLEGQTLAECAESYFRVSEQLPTRIMLAVTPGTKGNGHAPVPWRASGIMIQQIAGTGGEVGRTPAPLPDEGFEDAPGETWNRASILFDSLTSTSLPTRNLRPEDVLYRLYHEDGVRVFDLAGGQIRLPLQPRAHRRRHQDLLRGRNRRNHGQRPDRSDLRVLQHDLCARSEGSGLEFRLNSTFVVIPDVRRARKP